MKCRSSSGDVTSDGFIYQSSQGQEGCVDDQGIKRRKGESWSCLLYTAGSGSCKCSCDDDGKKSCISTRNPQYSNNKRPDFCLGPSVESVDGTYCMALFERYYFDKKSGKCKEFGYGGCGATRNNFETLSECEETCKAGSSDLVWYDNKKPKKSRSKKSKKKLVKEGRKQPGSDYILILPDSSEAEGCYDYDGKWRRKGERFGPGCTCADGAPNCVFSGVNMCTDVWRPVCAEDGRTYDNECRAREGGVEVKCDGQCPCSAAGSDCYEIYSPVCGVDGTTYSNDCMALAEGVEVACDGECPCPAARPVVCGADYSPVCGADGSTYSNLCGAQAEGVEVECDGMCPCPAPTVCFAIYSPVCGDDGETYSSQCMAQAKGVVVKCDGECPCLSGVSGSSGSRKSVYKKYKKSHSKKTKKTKKSKKSKKSWSKKFSS